MAFTNFYEKLDQLCISLVTIHDEFLLDWFNMFLLVDVEFIWVNHATPVGHHVTGHDIMNINPYWSSFSVTFTKNDGASH